MKLLDRYLFGQFTKNLGLVLCSLLTIYLLVDFFEKVDNFLEAQKTVGLAVQYLFLKIPLIYDQLIPVCILLAGVITLGVLNHNHEFMAMKAGGLSAFRIVTPIMGGAIFFIFLTLIMAEWVLPPTVSTTNRIWFEEVKKVKTQGIKRSGRIFYRGKAGIYSFRQPDPQKHLFTDFSYASWDDNYRMAMLLTFEKAEFDSGLWTFTNGQIKRPASDCGFAIETFRQHQAKLPESPDEFFIPAYKSDEQSLSQLAARALDSGPADPSGWRDLHRRLSYIFLGLPLLLLGLPILLMLNRRWGRDLSLAIPVSCGLAFAAWGWWSTSQSMVKAYNLNPAMASWSIHLVIGTIGILMIKRQDR